MRKRHWLYSGCGIPIAFFITTFVCGFVQGNYNHLSRQVSELGTIGTKSRYLFSGGLILSSFLSVLFIIALLRLKQRFFHVGWSVWFVYLSLAISGISRQRTNQ
jgi:hypothetical membrane protein